MSNKIIPWDLKNSNWKMVIYFYNDEKRESTNTRKQVFYSKVVGKPEPVDSFSVMRAKAHAWRGNNHGYSSALICNNLKEGKPKILQIDSQGRELPIRDLSTTNEPK